VPVSEGSSETVDYGFVGDIDSVNAAVIEKLLDDGLMPVVSPCPPTQRHLAQHQCRHGAAAIGGALAAEKLCCARGAGILESVSDPSTVISYTDLQGLKRLRDSGA